MALRAILFDLDDTLYGYAPCNEAGLRAAHERLAREVTASYDDFRACHDEVRLELAEQLKGQAASHNRAIFFKRIVERLVGPGRGSLAVELFETYWRVFLDTMQPAPAALQLLEELSRTHSLALVSNHTTEVQLRKLEALGLEPYFEVVMTSEEAGVEKPDPRIFEQALRALGVAPADSVMVGDGPGVDLLGAQRAGVRCILSREFAAAGLDGCEGIEILDSLSELPGKLARASG